jgi:hypothetical protein
MSGECTPVGERSLRPIDHPKWKSLVFKFKSLQNLRMDAKLDPDTFSLHNPNTISRADHPIE